MIRPGSSSRALLVITLSVLAAGACGDRDGDGDDTTSTVTAAGAPATLPDDVPAGTGRLLLDGDEIALAVRSCTLTPTADPATGVTTDVAVDADDGRSIAVSVTRTSFAGDLPTTTDEMLVVDDGTPTVQSRRVDRSGTYLDLRVDGPSRPLVSVAGDLLTAGGTFGPADSQLGDPGLVVGSLVLRCPPAG